MNAAAEEEVEYTIYQVSQAAGVSARTLRYWTTRGLLESPENHAWATRYSAAYRARACAIQKLREAGMNWDDVRAELQRLDRPPPPPPPVPAPPAATVVAEAPPRRPPPPPSFPSEHWEHIVIVPGLELRVNLRGGQILRKMAQEIYSQYGPAPLSASEAPDV